MYFVLIDPFGKLSKLFGKYFCITLEFFIKIDHVYNINRLKCIVNNNQ